MDQGLIDRLHDGLELSAFVVGGARDGERIDDETHTIDARGARAGRTPSV